jgi:recombination protein RecR
MIDNLVKAFMALPGVGEKTAYRFAYHFLQNNKNAGLKLASELEESIKNITNCKTCNTLSTSEECEICANTKRDNTKICVVKNPLDITSIEKTGYSGKYFVLGNYISPIDNITPNDLKLDLLRDIVLNNQVNEIILATSATVEGEITNNYIANLFTDKNIKITRLVRGIPLGGELEYTDTNTLTKAFNDRH